MKRKYTVIQYYQIEVEIPEWDGAEAEFLEQKLYEGGNVMEHLKAMEYAPKCLVADIDVMDFGVCRVCGCTDDNCEQCVEAQGFPCEWVEEDLCSRCANQTIV